MNAEEFVDTYIGMLKLIGKHTLKLNKSDVRKALARGHIALTPADMDHYSQKLCHSISYVKRRLRQQGSGKYLPSGCRALLKVSHQKNMTHATLTQSPKNVRI